VRFQSQPGHAMAQAVNCRAVTPEASDLRHFVGICVGQSGTATGISAVLRLSVSASFHQYSILVHLSFVDAFSVDISSLNNTCFHFYRNIIRSTSCTAGGFLWFPPSGLEEYMQVFSSILSNSHGHAVISLGAM
jgi:hypothetical protein